MFITISYYVGWAVIGVLAKIMLRKNVVAYAPVPKGPKILVANHPTVSDPFVLFTTLRERISILIYHKVFSIPLFGTYLKMAGHIPVVQGNGQKAFNRALEFLNQGVSVLVFMEGDISPEVGQRAPRTGAVRLAIHSGAPIVPIGVSVHKKNIRYINGTVGGTRVRETWYLHGMYAITIGKQLRVVGDPDNRTKVNETSKMVMAQVSKLAEESATRIRVQTSR